MGIANRAVWYQDCLTLRREMEKWGYVKEAKDMTKSVLGASSNDAAMFAVETWTYRFQYAVGVHPEPSGITRTMPVRNVMKGKPG